MQKFTPGEKIVIKRTVEFINKVIEKMNIEDIIHMDASDEEVAEEIIGRLKSCGIDIEELSKAADEEFSMVLDACAPQTSKKEMEELEESIEKIRNNNPANRYGPN
jgi:hypothetical protein